MKVNAESLIAQINALIDWINANKVEDGVVIPPVVPPVTPPPVTPPPVTPPVSGQFTSIIVGAKRCNTKLDKIGGYGFYDKNIPGPASIPAGRKTYFLFDPVWLPSRWTQTGVRLTIMWIDMSLNPNFSANLYEIDALDNGKFIANDTGNQSLFTVSFKPNTRWLLEIDATKSPTGFGLSVRWPN